MIVLLFQSARKYIENQDATEIQLPRVYVDPHPECSRGVGLIEGTATKKVSFDRKQLSVQAPGFIRGSRKKLRILITCPRIYQWGRFVQFFNLKSQISNRLTPL